MSRNADATLFTIVDDELFDQLDELTDQEIRAVEVWEDSLTADLGAQLGAPATDPTMTTTFDLDLYLQDGVYLELYGTQCFPDLESEPWQDRDRVKARLITLIKQGLSLDEIAVNEADGLVLVLGRAGTPRLYLDVGAWLIEEWDELPDA